jgi:hypothetical protein
MSQLQDLLRSSEASLTRTQDSQQMVRSKETHFGHVQNGHVRGHAYTSRVQETSSAQVLRSHECSTTTYLQDLQPVRTHDSYPGNLQEHPSGSSSKLWQTNSLFNDGPLGHFSDFQPTNQLMRTQETRLAGVQQEPQQHCNNAGSRIVELLNTRLPQPSVG